MAELMQNDLYNLYTGHSDIRRDIAKESSDVMRHTSDDTKDINRDVNTGFSDARYENAINAAKTDRDVNKGFSDVRYEAAMGIDRINGDIKATGWSVADRVGAETDRVMAASNAQFIATLDREYDMGRDLATLKADADAAALRSIADVSLVSERAVNAATLAGERASTAAILASEKLAAASAIASERNLAAITVGQANISREISNDGNATRALINQLKFDTLNRELVERNSSLVAHHHDHHGLHRDLLGHQFAGLTSQMQNFQSQLQDTKQSINNFGTMAGSGQSSTSNNVR